MNTFKRLLPWLLLGLSAVVVMGSDCEIEADEDHFSFDTDHHDNWFDDLFDKRISMLPASDYFA